MDVTEFRNRLQAAMEAIEVLTIGQAFEWEVEPVDLGNVHLELSKIRTHLDAEIRMIKASREET